MEVQNEKGVRESFTREDIFSGILMDEQKFTK